MARSFQSIRFRSPVVRAGEVPVKRPLSSNGGWSADFPGRAIFPATPVLLLARLQTWLSERPQQKLMYDKGSLSPTPCSSLLRGAEAWRSRAACPDGLSGCTWVSSMVDAAKSGVAGIWESSWEQEALFT